MGTGAPEDIREKQASQFRKEGYFLLERIVPDDNLQMLRQECQQYLDERNAEMDRLGVDVLDLDHRNKRYFISMKYKDSERMQDFLFSDLMADICRATIGGEAYFFLEQFVVKYAEKGTQFSWHQDSGYIPYDHRPYLTCWCTLDDVTEASGTIYILPYSRAGSR